MFSLNGKLALVTGSSRGVGRAIAVALAQAGADIILHCRRDVQRCDALKAEITSYGVRCDAVCADMGNPDEIKAMFQYIDDKYGKLDILVNNAAVLTRKPFLELTSEDWDYLLQTNSRGYFLSTQHGAKLMKKTGAGRIINISSISQFEAAVNRTHYCASKGAIAMLSKSSALELAPHKITVNSILPGSIHTDFNNDVLSNADFYRKCEEGIPLARLGRPEDIAGAAVFLSSEEASYITGAEIVIDGGKTLE